MSVFDGHFSALFSTCDDCILKSTTAWLLKLSVLYIHSFMHIHNTFQIKTIFNNVLFSTEVHNPLHAHPLAPSHIYIYIVCMYVCVCVYIYAYYHYCFNYYYHYYFLFSCLVANYQEPVIVHNSTITTTHSDINTNLDRKTHNAWSIWQLTCQKS